MNKFIKAKFDTFDDAEKAALSLNKHLNITDKIHVYPKYPESVQLTIPHEKRFTLLPTAVTSMNYYTLLVETEYNFENISEERKRQTSFIEFECDDSSVSDAEKLLIGMGASFVYPS